MNVAVSRLISALALDQVVGVRERRRAHAHARERDNFVAPGTWNESATTIRCSPLPPAYASRAPNVGIVLKA